MQPGDTITPTSDNTPQPEQTESAPPQVPMQPATVEAPQVPEPTPVALPEPSAEETVPQEYTDTPDTDAISWTASEFVAHQKTHMWYVLLGVVFILGAAAVFVIVRDIISSVVILLVGIMVGVAGARKPRTVQYHLTHDGIYVGQKLFPFGQFKSFSVIEEGVISSLSFMPLQRLMPPLSIYYDPADEDRIVDMLSLYLPYVERQHDVLDRFMRKIHF